MYDRQTLAQIVDILKDEQKVLGRIVELEETKCNLLVANEYEGLDLLNVEETELQAQLHALEKERLYTGTRMGHRAADPGSLRELILAVDGEDRDTLIQAQHSLNALVQRLQFLKNLTVSLIEDKRRMIEVTMAAARGETDTIEYTHGGDTRPVTTGNKPIVINRSV